MTFKKGQSGNPSGRPQKDNELKKLCKKATAKNFARIQELAESGEEESTRLKATQWLLEYAWGKPSQAVELGGKEGGDVTLVIRDGK